MDIGVLSMLEIVRNINEIFEKRKATLFALCQFYAAKAVNVFNTAQGDDFFWNNQTFQAKDSVFAEAVQETDFIGFFIAHGKDYGVYLELANDRQNESLRPIINAMWPDFIKDVKKIYGAN